jgi:ubiquinone biosynthesis protein UbiJ
MEIKIEVPAPTAEQFKWLKDYVKALAQDHNKLEERVARLEQDHDQRANAPRDSTEGA